MNKLTQQTMALAATLQAGYLVNKLARKGECNDTEKTVLIESLFKLNNNDAFAIYDGADNLQTGFKLFKQMLTKDPAIKQNKEPIYYGIQLNVLAKKISREKKILALIGAEITALSEQQHFDHTHLNTQAKLAELYRQSAGKLSPTLMISGESVFLNNTVIANQIRTLLLSGIRASMLRRAHGSNPLTILIYKRRILEIINDLADN